MTFQKSAHEVEEESTWWRSKSIIDCRVRCLSCSFSCHSLLINDNWSFWGLQQEHNDKVCCTFALLLSFRTMAKRDNNRLLISSSFFFRVGSHAHLFALHRTFCVSLKNYQMTRVMSDKCLKCLFYTRKQSFSVTMTFLLRRFFDCSRASWKIKICIKFCLFMINANPLIMSNSVLSNQDPIRCCLNA